MKLSEKQKAILRNQIVEQMNNYGRYRGEPRAHIDKEILEELLFEKCEYTALISKFDYDTATISFGTKKLCAKYLVWTGPFLSKIDLSEVSFDDVEWNIDYFDDKEYQILDGEGIVRNYYEGIEKIDLSNTNAVIDFDKSFNPKVFELYDITTHGEIDAPEVRVVGCDFSNVNLSNSINKSYCDFTRCIFNGSQINTAPKFLIRYEDCDLSNIDLSNINATVNILFDEDSKNKLCFSFTNLTNTGLHINFDPTKQEWALEDLKDLIMDGYLEGCYINGNLISVSQNENVEQIGGFKR